MLGTMCFCWCICRKGTLNFRLRRSSFKATISIGIVYTHAISYKNIIYIYIYTHISILYTYYCYHTSQKQSHLLPMFPDWPPFEFSWGTPAGACRSQDGALYGCGLASSTVPGWPKLPRCNGSELAWRMNPKMKLQRDNTFQCILYHFILL